MKRPQDLNWSLGTVEDSDGIRKASVLAGLIGLLCIGASLSGCGKQGFVVAASTAAQEAPGTFTIPAKVDILMLEDDTGSMAEAYDAISRQVPSFLEQLEGKGWNYHFAVAPLTKYRALSEVLASKHDGNWGSEWKPASPGQAQFELGMLTPSVFRKPGEFGAFLNFSDVRYDLSGLEPGFHNLKKVLFEGTTGTSFIRPDAMLVVFALSTGNDTSGIKYCKRIESGQEVIRPCEQASGTQVSCGLPNNENPGICGTSTASLDYYKTEIAKIKPSTGLLRFYAATTNGETDCPNLPDAARSRSGSRYYSMTQSFGGESFNLCHQSIDNIFSSLAGKLADVKIAIRTKYLFIDEEPNQESIVVTVHRGGSSSSNEVIPRSDSNGWTYIGYQKDLPASEYSGTTVTLNKGTGFAIRLNGSAVLSGADTASVEFKTAGLQDSAK